YTEVEVGASVVVSVDVVGIGGGVDCGLITVGSGITKMGIVSSDEDWILGISY
ncbi:hypothetical protein Tco_1189418, partial [Tanacetum coccineum]